MEGRPLSRSGEHPEAGQRVEAKLADGQKWEDYYDTMGQLIEGSKRNATGTAVPGRQFGYEYIITGIRQGDQADICDSRASTAGLKKIKPRQEVSGLGFFID